MSGGTDVLQMFHSPDSATLSSGWAIFLKTFFATHFSGVDSCFIGGKMRSYSSFILLTLVRFAELSGDNSAGEVSVLEVHMIPQTLIVTGAEKHPL